MAATAHHRKLIAFGSHAWLQLHTSPQLDRVRVTCIMHLHTSPQRDSVRVARIVSFTSALSFATRGLGVFSSFHLLGERMLRTQPHFWFGRGYGPIFRDDLKRYNVLFCSELEKTCVALCPRVTNGPSDPFSVPEEWMKLPQGGWNSGRWTCSPRLSYKEFLKQSAMLPKALLEQCLQSASMAHGGLYFTLETAKDRLWQPRGDGTPCRRPWRESHDRFHGRTAGLGAGDMDVPSVAPHPLRTGWFWVSSCWN